MLRPGARPSADDPSRASVVAAARRRARDRGHPGADNRVGPPRADARLPGCLARRLHRGCSERRRSSTPAPLECPGRCSCRRSSAAWRGPCPKRGLVAFSLDRPGPQPYGGRPRERPRWAITSGERRLVHTPRPERRGGARGVHRRRLDARLRPFPPVPLYSCGDAPRDPPVCRDTPPEASLGHVLAVRPHRRPCRLASLCRRRPRAPPARLHARLLPTSPWGHRHRLGTALAAVVTDRRFAQRPLVRQRPRGFPGAAVDS